MTTPPNSPDPAVVAVITLWQPWASLVFAPDGNGSFFKKHETRSFRYPARLRGETIAIHAAKAFPAWRHISSELHDLCTDAFGCQYQEVLPLGTIVGTVALGDCIATDGLFALPLDDEDRIAGDWSPGRFAWRLNDVAALAQPLPAIGRQGWWSIDRDHLRAAQKGEGPKATVEREAGNGRA